MCRAGCGYRCGFLLCLVFALLFVETLAVRQAVAAAGLPRVVLILAGPALHLALGAVLLVGALWPAATQARDAVAHVQQHHLQGVGVHAPLVGLSRSVHVLHHAPILPL